MIEQITLTNVEGHNECIPAKDILWITAKTGGDVGNCDVAFWGFEDGGSFAELVSVKETALSIADMLTKLGVETVKAAGILFTKEGAHYASNPASRLPGLVEEDRDYLQRFAKEGAVHPATIAPPANDVSLTATPA